MRRKIRLLKTGTCFSRIAARVSITAALLLSASAWAHAQVSLTPTSSPSSGQPGITIINVIGTNFPAGSISPAQVQVKLQPAGAAQTSTATATAVTTIVGTTRRVTFMIPSGVIVTAPTGYLVSVSGVTAGGISFSSSNSASLTVNPLPSISSLNPASSPVAQSLNVTITGTYTNFVQGATQASFGAGIGVGGSAAGAMGPVTVTGPTSANAQLSIAPGAAGGARTVTVQTGIQQAVLQNGFTVTTAGPPLISALQSPAPNADGWNNSNVTVTFICTGAGAPITSCSLPVTVANEGASQIVTGTTTDASGSSAQATVALNIDKTPPSVSIASPQNGTTVFSAQVTANGTAADALSGVSGVSCNGAPASLIGSDFVCNVTIGSSGPSIAVQAADIAGNVGSATVALTLITAPTVTVTSPANLTFTNTSPVTVRGTVNDPNATVTVNGIPAPLSGGTFSTLVPLTEGSNTLTAVATNAAGNAGTGSVTVTLDTAPPHVTIETPSPNSVTTESAVAVAGTVNDIVVGTVNDQEAQVTVNGINAQVANRTYSASSVPLVLGANPIQVVARDRAGNSVTTSSSITRVSAAQPPQPAIGEAVITSSLSIISGNTQTGTIGTQLLSPLVVQLSNSSGNPVANQPIVFKVSGNNGLVSSGSAPAVAVAVNTDSNGQARAFWTLGQRSGAGIDSVLAASPLAIAPVTFTATAATATASQIVSDSGDNQIEIAGRPLSFPLGVVVTDNGSNRVPNVPVIFSIIDGGGSLNGGPSQTINTDSDGRALAVLTLGPLGGNGNNVVRAALAGNPAAFVSFSASGKIPGNPADTTISGTVLDNSNNPIPNVTVRLFQTNQGSSNNLPQQIGTPVATDARGAFVIHNAPFGYFKLMADGTTATGGPSYPTLEYSIVTVAGKDNTVGVPIYLPALDTVNKLCVDETHGGTLALPQSPGFALTVEAGSATFPGGSRSGCITVTTVNPDKVPMTPGFGQQPRFIVSIQPAGTLFSPPAPISLPNVEGLAPRAITEMYSYDHDLSMFVAIGTGTVSSDGSSIVSNPGVGVLKAGWHCGGDPKANGHVADCPAGKICQGDKCVPDPAADGNPCADVPAQYVRNGVTVNIDNACRGVMKAGKCVPSPQGFSIGAIRSATDAALDKIFDNSINACIEATYRTELQNKLKRPAGLLVLCNPNSTGTECGHAPSVGGNYLVLTPRGMQGQCGNLGAVVMHELGHAMGKDSGAPDLDYHNNVNSTNPVDCRDRVYGCAESCFPGTSSGSTLGNPFACQLTPLDQAIQLQGCNPCKTVNGKTVCTTMP